MNNENWQLFLQTRHSDISTAAITAMHHDDMANLDILTDLSHHGLIAVDGEDSLEFLQNQFSNDVRQLNPSCSQLNSYSSPKGRMFAIFRLFEWQQRYYLRMPTALIEPVIKRLQMFVLRSKVTLSVANDELQRIGIAGPNAVNLLSDMIKELPQAVDETSNSANYKVLKVPGEQRFEIYASGANLQTLWAHLDQHAKTANADAWPLLDIYNGLPNIYPETREHFVAQMTNLHLVNGVSFKKGCYPGQEIVARMQYLGTLKRRMYLINFAAQSPPKPGSNIVSLAGDTSREVGEIVDARIFSPGQPGQCAALAVLQTNSIEQPLHVDHPNGPAITLQELPYSFP